MSVLPPNLSRSPNLLASQMILASLQRANTGLLGINDQLSSGLRVSKPSDDPVAYATISVLQSRLGYADQYAKNLSWADSTLSTLDNSLSQTNDLVSQARSLASGMIGVGVTAKDRSNNVGVVDEMIRTLFTEANRNIDGLYLYGGSTPGQPPVQEVSGGYRFTARGAGLIPDLGNGERIPITLGGNNAIGETSARMVSLTQLNPDLTASTALGALRGPRGLGVSTGTIQFSFNAGPAQSVDLTGAATIGDVRTRINAAISAYETAASVTVLGAGQVSLNGQGLNFDVAAGGSLVFTDVANGNTALDLGLRAAPFTPLAKQGQNLSPELGLQSTLASLPGLTLPLGTLRIKMTSGNATTTRDIDLSGATTLDDVRSQIESSGIGARLEINDQRNGLIIRNEVSGPTLTVEEVPGGTTATQLGLRTLSANTPLADLNNGRGVGIKDGVNDPVTGLPSATLNKDLRITLGNGQWFDVDLRPQDTTNMTTLLARINAEFTSAIGSQNNPAQPALAGGDFVAALVNGPNGISLKSATIAGAITAGDLNNSPAADDLGLKNLTFDAASSSYIAQDRSGVRVNNLFTQLLDLRNALASNSTSGITLAGNALDTSGDRVVAAQGLVGSYGQRVASAQSRLENQKVLDTKLKSDLQDLDYTDAAVKFSTLQTQLQATQQVAGRINARTLLDFLG